MTASRTVTLDVPRNNVQDIGDDQASRLAKDPVHQGLIELTNNTSSHSGSRPGHATAAKSLEASVTPDQDTTESTIGVQTVKSTALADTITHKRKSREGKEDHGPSRPKTKASRIRFNKPIKSDHGTNIESSHNRSTNITADVNTDRTFVMPNAAVPDAAVHIDNNKQIMTELAKAHFSVASVNGQSNDYIATRAYSDTGSEAPNASIRDSEVSLRTISTNSSATANAYENTSAHGISLDPRMLRWRSTPFTLYSIKSGLYCPRLNVELRIALALILPSRIYSLDTAVRRVHRHGVRARSLPCEALRVLVVYDEIHRLEFAGIKVTLLDLEVFLPSYDYILEKQVAFYAKIGRWIDIIGLPFNFSMLQGQ